MPKTKKRGNGQGTAYKRGRTWEAQVIVGWKVNAAGDKLIPVKRRKGGFATKADAIAYCPKLALDGNKRKRMTMEQLYKVWSESYAPRVGASTMDGYKYAYKHFAKLHGIYMDEISSDDLQKCMDACKSGHRTHQNMKCVAGLLWGYAFDHNVVDKDVTDNLFIGRGTSVQRDPITDAEVEAIRQSIGKIRYAEYVYCMCYLGFRPGEMLELKKDMLFCAEIPQEEGQPDLPVWYFVNGKKTEAGKDRIVIVPNQILDIVLDRVLVPGTDLVFPMYKFNRKSEPTLECFKPMSHDYFNKHVFKPMMRQLGLDDTKVPYCARHTYGDLLKDASGSDKDKAALIGHSKYLFTQNHYQSSHIADLKALVDSFRTTHVLPASDARGIENQ